MGLRDRLEAGDVLFTAWSGVPDSIIVELLALQPFDAVTLDMQHGAHAEDSVVRCIQPILAAKKPAIVRIPVGRFDMASRALDFGADAVIGPMINSLEDAKLFAAAMKYPPLGERSWGPTFGLPRRGGTMPEWLGKSNDRTLSFAMVETRAALALVDGILDTPGIDGIFLGPADFSIAWTNGASVNPRNEDMMGAVEDVARRTRAKGKFAAIYLSEPADSGKLASWGFQLFAFGQEVQLFARGAEAILNPARAALAKR